MKKALIGAAVVVAVVAAGVLLLSKEKKTGPKYRKEAVTRGDVVANVTATGTLSAVTTVKVGSQVSGKVAQLFADFKVDTEFCTHLLQPHLSEQARSMISRMDPAKTSDYE